MFYNCGYLSSKSNDESDEFLDEYTAKIEEYITKISK